VGSGRCGRRQRRSVVGGHTNYVRRPVPRPLADRLNPPPVERLRIDGPGDRARRERDVQTLVHARECPFPGGTGVLNHRRFANSISLQIRKIGADDRIYAPYGRSFTGYEQA
jgi:hypothetical protein